MSLLESLKRRRVVPWLGAYLAGGFLVLEGVDQLVGYEFIPELAYRIVLVFYLFGVPGTIVLAWFHGERGQQELERSEIWLQSMLLVGALLTSVVVFRDYRADQATRIDVAAEIGLDPRGVAVLYFEDLDGGLGFVADGLTEALIDRLSAVRALDVISRNGVEPFRESELSADSVARILSVRNVIEGSVEPRGGEIRVTARLVDGFSGVDVDRTSFDVDAEDLLAARDSLALRIAESLRQRLGEEVRVRETRGGTASVEAWSSVQRAERLIRNAEEFEERDELDAALTTLAAADSTLMLAETADPEWVEPVVLRAEVQWVIAFLHAVMGDLETSERQAIGGLALTERALNMSPRDPEALEMRGTLRYWLWQLGVTGDHDESERALAAAREDLESAVDADPTLATAWSQLAHLYGNTGDLADMIIAARRAYEEDAYLRTASRILGQLFWGRFDQEQFNDAQERCDTGRARFPEDPRFVRCEMYLLLAPVREPDPDSAWALHERLVQLAPEAQRPYEERLGYLLVGGVMNRAGLADSAQTLFERGRANEQIDPEMFLLGEEAKIRSATGDVDAAMEVAKRYVAANPGHSFEVGGQIHWMWRPLREHPEFRSVMQR